MDPSEGHWELRKTPRMLSQCCDRASQNSLDSHYRLCWEEVAEVPWLGLFCLVEEAGAAQVDQLSSCRAAQWSLWYQDLLGLHLW